MKYVILIQSNPRSQQLWERLSEQERLDFGRAHLALSKELLASGELVASEGLPDLSEAKRVSVREGRTLTTDGPFAEAKEYLAGFYLVDCASLERAIEIASRTPDAAHGEVEVRPVLDLREFDQ